MRSMQFQLLVMMMDLFPLVAALCHLDWFVIRATQHGFVGLNIYAPWFLPYTKATEDVIATQRAIDFYMGWFLHPLVFGDYPDIMKKNAGTRIPVLTPHESKLVKGSFDFIGLNHYATLYIKDNSSSLKMENRDVLADIAAITMFEPGDSSLDQDNGSSGLYKVLEYLKKVYANPPTYVHENGRQTVRNGTLNDTERVKYMHAYIGTLLDALRNGVSNTKGYFSWSFLDGFEVSGGYEYTFGLFYVDLDDKQLRRYTKLSAHWYSNFLKGRTIRTNEITEVVNETSVSSKSHASQ